MTVLGIVSEYNPFHNGHLYHLNKSMEITGADAVIAIMSGNFTQRGEPAVFNKWIRTEAAIRCGVNLVVELPVCYSTSSAELFSFGAVSLLNNLGIVDYISFGSETDDMDGLIKISKLLATENDLFKGYLKNFLANGYSFAKARQLALNKFDVDDNIVKSPNNILGIEYLKWLIRLNSSIKPVMIERIGSGYNQADLNEKLFFSSATSIRYAMNNGSLSSVKRHIPQNSYEIMNKEIKNGVKPTFKKDMDEIIFYELLKNQDLGEIFDVSEGLNNRIKNMLYRSDSLDGLLLNIKTRRYAYSRVSRILFHSLIKYTKQEAAVFNKTGPRYVRILGFDSVGRNLINIIDKKCDLKLITNVSKQYRSLDDTAKEMLDKDILATDIYSLAGKGDKMGLGKDFLNRPVMITR